MTNDDDGALPEYNRLAAAAIPEWCVPPRRPRNRAQLADAICQIMRHAQGASECQFCNGAACSSLEATAVADLVLALGLQLEQRWQATDQHRKGGLYRVIARGSLEADLTPAVVYDDAEGRVWIRPAAEFDDGRFTPLSGERR